MLNPSDVVEHMEVVGSDGEHVGTVDHLAIMMTKSDYDAEGRHHVIPIELADSVRDGKLVLTCSAEEAKMEQFPIDE